MWREYDEPRGLGQATTVHRELSPLPGFAHSPSRLPPGLQPMRHAPGPPPRAQRPEGVLHTQTVTAAGCHGLRLRGVQQQPRLFVV